MANPTGSWTATSTASDMIPADSTGESLTIQVTSGVVYLLACKNASDVAVSGQGILLDATNGPKSISFTKENAAKRRWSGISSAGASGVYHRL